MMDRVGGATGIRWRVQGAPRWFGAVALVAVLSGVLLAPLEVVAGRQWCKTDPVVLIDGQLADILVMVPLEQLQEVDGATEIILTIPDASEAAMVSPGVGFGYGEKLSIVKSPLLSRTADWTEVKIEVLVPGTNPLLPVRVEFAPRVLGLLDPVAREGAADRWLRMKTDA